MTLLSRLSRSSYRSRLVYMLKSLFDRDTNKCLDKDIIKYLDKYHNKRIIKYKAELINKNEKKRINKCKNCTIPSTSRSTSFNPYLRCSPSITPMPSSHCPNTTFTPLPRRLHTAANSCAATSYPHCFHTATTLRQRRCKAAFVQLHAALTLPSRHCSLSPRLPSPPLPTSSSQ